MMKVGLAGLGKEARMRPVKRLMVFLVAVLTVTGFVLQACAPTATRESTGEYLDDAAITTKIKTKLLGDPVVSGFAVSVETFRSRVVLSGFVNSQTQVDRAIALAREVPGVREVQSALVIKSK
jgi:osmotically-inducible protein OsmY